MRRTARERFNVSLGGGLGKLGGKIFRIGHLGDLNEPMLLGALAAVEMSLRIEGIPHGRGGVEAAMTFLAGANKDTWVHTNAVWRERASQCHADDHERDQHGRHHR